MKRRQQGGREGGRRDGEGQTFSPCVYGYGCTVRKGGSKQQEPPEDDEDRGDAVPLECEKRHARDANC